MSSTPIDDSEDEKSCNTYINHLVGLSSHDVLREGQAASIQRIPTRILCRMMSKLFREHFNSDDQEHYVALALHTSASNSSRRPDKPPSTIERAARINEGVQEPLMSGALPTPEPPTQLSGYKRRMLEGSMTTSNKRRRNVDLAGVRSETFGPDELPSTPMLDNIDLRRSAVRTTRPRSVTRCKRFRAKTPFKRYPTRSSRGVDRRRCRSSRATTEEVLIAIDEVEDDTVNLGRFGGGISNRNRVDREEDWEDVDDKTYCDPKGSRTEGENVAIGPEGESVTLSPERENIVLKSEEENIAFSREGLLWIPNSREKAPGIVRSKLLMS